MSSTDRGPDRPGSRELFESRILPLSRRLKSEGRSYFDPVDAGADSYFRRPRRTAMAREDFVLPACTDAGALAAALEAHWRSEGHPELAALAPALAALSRTLRVEAVQSDDVSPFIYVMF